MRTSKTVLFLILALSALWRWGPIIATKEAYLDEQSYLEAARHLREGRSPYAEPTYIYPPALAIFVDLAVDRLGEAGTLRLLRVSSLAGILAVVMCALEFVAWPWLVRCLTGVLFVSLAPAVRIATVFGNVAGVTAPLVLLGLVLWKHRPIASGAALALGLVIKPIAPLAPVLLLFHRPATGGRQHWLAAGACAFTGIVLGTVGIEFLPDLLANAGQSTSPYNFSLHKILVEFGLDVPPLLVSLFVAAIALTLVRTRELGQTALLTIAVTVSLFTLPMVWAHSLLLMLPIQLLAIDRCAQAIARWDSLERLQRLGTILVLLATASTFFCDAIAVQGLPRFGVDLARLSPLISSALLAWFVIATSSDAADQDTC